MVRVLVCVRRGGVFGRFCVGGCYGTVGVLKGRGGIVLESRFRGSGVGELGGEGVRRFWMKFGGRVGGI